MTISITADVWIDCTHCERRFQRPTPRRRAAFIRTHAGGCSAPDVKPRRHSTAKRASDIDIITGLPVDEIAAQHGLSPKELRKWCRRRGHLDLVVQLGGRVS